MARYDGRATSRAYFPWESRGGVLRRLGLARARPAAAALGLVVFVVVIAFRERERAGVRQTRAILAAASRAVEVHLADHDGRCPPDLATAVRAAGLEGATVDAWGRPLRLVCPSRSEGKPFDLLSDGPDGKPLGLDRIE